MSKSFYGKPVEVLTFLGNEKFKVNEKAFNEILLQEDVKNRKIVFLTISGEMRQGKSFFLNYCLRYLYARYPSVNKRNFERKNDWMGANDENLVGFDWKSSSEAVTKGIIMWSDVFLSDYNGVKSAIVIIDTQGLFDNSTLPSDNARILALTTLLSSIQILNLHTRVHENKLEFLQYAANFSKLAFSDSEITKPFQNLLFLIRDWPNPKEYPYGMEGGIKYQETFLTKKGGNSQLNEVRDFIARDFRNVETFLMPSPGETVSIDEADCVYNGNNGDMSQRFKQKLKELIEHLLSPENLSVKIISGIEVNGVQARDYMFEYFKQFQSGNMPQPEDLQKNFYRIVEDNFVKNNLNVYTNHIEENKSKITETNLIEIHEEAKTITWRKYESEKRKVFGKRDDTEARQQLTRLMEGVFAVWVKQARIALADPNGDVKGAIGSVMNEVGNFISLPFHVIATGIQQITKAVSDVGNMFVNLFNPQKPRKVERLEFNF